MRLRFFTTSILLFALFISACAAPENLPRIPKLHRQAIDYSSRGTLFYHKACLTKALEYYMMAHELFTITDNRLGVADSLNNIGNIYRLQSNVDEAIVFYTRAADIFQSNDMTIKLMKTYCNLAAVHLTIGDFTTAKTYLVQAEILQNKTSYTYLPITTSRVLLLVKTGQHTEALKLINTTLQSESKLTETFVSSFYYAVAQYYDAMNNFDQAIHFLNQALTIDKTNESIHNIGETLFSLGTIETKNNNPEQAINYFKRSYFVFKLIHNEAKADKSLLMFKQTLKTDLDDSHEVFHYFSELWSKDNTLTSPCD